MMTAPERFEDRLLHHLRRIVADRPAPAAGLVARRRPQRTHLALGGVGITVATVAIAVIATSGSVTPSAYAVEPGSNGTVTVSIHGLDDAAGLQSSLRAAGVPAVVDFAASGTGCVAPPADGSGPGAEPTLHTSFGHGAAPRESATRSEGPTTSGEPDSSSDPGKVSGPVTSKVSGGVRVDKDGVTFSIDPGTLEPGQKVYITTSKGAVDSIGIAVGTTAPGPNCAS